MTDPTSPQTDPTSPNTPSSVSDPTTPEDKPKATWEPDYVGPKKTVTQDFTYPTHTDPRRRVGPANNYLDDVQRKEAEIQRAKVEGRKPDLENPPAMQSTPLVPTHLVTRDLPGDWPAKPDVQLEVVIGNTTKVKK